MTGLITTEPQTVMLLCVCVGFVSYMYTVCIPAEAYLHAWVCVLVRLSILSLFLYNSVCGCVCVCLSAHVCVCLLPAGLRKRRMMGQSCLKVSGKHIIRQREQPWELTANLNTQPQTKLTTTQLTRDSQAAFSLILKENSAVLLMGSSVIITMYSPS